MEKTNLFGLDRGCENIRNTTRFSIKFVKSPDKTGIPLWTKQELTVFSSGSCRREDGEMLRAPRFLQMVLDASTPSCLLILDNDDTQDIGVAFCIQGQLKIHRWI